MRNEDGQRKEREHCFSCTKDLCDSGTLLKVSFVLLNLKNDCKFQLLKLYISRTLNVSLHTFQNAPLSWQRLLDFNSEKEWTAKIWPFPNPHCVCMMQISYPSISNFIHSTLSIGDLIFSSFKCDTL